ncbi:MAG: hypothetical protein JNL87_17500 [Burkholderiaceae bacterium]|nr:hypothetical protein [Burkholderiaceae bacterium]
MTSPACRRLVALLLAALTALAWPVTAAPRVPTRDDEVLETLPLRGRDAAARELAALRAEAAASGPQAGDPAAAARLAQRYFDLALAQGDPRYVGYAEAVVARFADPLGAPLRLVRAQLRQYRHQFDAALADLAAALALDPDLAAAHAWRGAIFLVQARYDEAGIECAALQRLRREVLAGGCLGLLQAYGGALAQAEATLQQALRASVDADQRLWLLTRLGEVAHWRGQPARAEHHYREALALDRGDVYLLAAWSDFLLDSGRPGEVVALLARWEAADSLLLRLAEAEAALRRPEAARHRQTLADRYASARLRGDATHQAEQARFELRLRGDAAQALRLAADNYRVQREPRDARILVEAALAAGDPAAAQPVRDWLQRSGFEDVRLRRLALAQAPAPGSTSASASARR